MIPEQCIYIGHVMHMRLSPVKTFFRYRVFSLLLDLDSMDRTAKKLFFLSLNSFNLISFYEKDHGARDGTKLRCWVDSMLAKHREPKADKIFLLSFPRVLGYVFNPLSVYYCYKDNLLTSILYEVKNTHGDQITYIASAKVTEDGIIRTEQKKEMYVSPFIDMCQVYRFSLRPPDNRLAIRIRQSGVDGETLIAAQNGKADELRDSILVKCLLTHPLMTLKVIVAIHWQALSLFLKGIKVISYPGALKNLQNR